MRLLYYIFFNIPNSNKYSYSIIKEADFTMILPMIILAIASILVGYLFKDLYIGLGSPFNSIFTHPNNLSIIDTEFSIPTYMKLLPLILTIGFTILILTLYEYFYKIINLFLPSELFPQRSRGNLLIQNNSFISKGSEGSFGKYFNKLINI
jgi:NADH:ubiquinone oxidoreductase subunit 5 (subunit L)/multisubunit Na+/H+ antiporter MnhA subunit